MKTITIPFGAWTPDRPDLENACTEARNVYPTAGVYGPFAGATGTGDTVTGSVKGARMFRRSDTTAVIAGGTGTDLFVRTSSGVTASSLGLTVDADSYWRFERFGDYVFAVAVGEDTHYLTDVDSDTSWSAAPGSIPQARCIAQFNEFLVLGNVNDGTSYPYRVQWSQFNNPTGSWAADSATQAGSIDLEERYGAVVALAATRVPVVFQEYGVTQLAYVGPPYVWRGAREGYIERERGAVSTGAVIPVGDVAFFCAHDGFSVTDGSSVQPIGAGAVNDWFLSEVSDANLFRIKGGVNWDQRCVLWAFPSAAGGGTTLDRLLIYSWQERRWSYAVLTVDVLVESRVDAVTLEDLDALYPSGLDSIPISLDSAQFLPRGRRFAAWTPSGSNSELSTLDGDFLEARIEGGEFQPMPGQRVFVGGAYPLIENADESTTMRMGYRAQGKGSTVMYTSATSPGPAGFCPQRVDSRYVRPSMIVPAGADWDKAQGAQILFRPSGRR